jgi:hypothetical protein
MISYRISEADLLGRIKATWLTRAEAATAACQAAGKYVKKNAAGVEIEGIWSEIKDVFMKLQHDKCCYCERKLASVQYGKVEHDIEHYRPKSRVKNWFTAAVKAELPDWPAGLGRSGAKAQGYHLLPFDVRNYATSCKECNSALKSDYFPCGKEPVLDAVTPALAAAEEPWLIFPVGDLDESAESLIQFEGITAQPVHDATSDPRRHWRARVTIRFFQLNVPTSAESDTTAPAGRENLYRERAEEISSLADCLDALETTTSAERRAQRERKIKRLTAPDSRHVNCKRSFLKLWADPATRDQAIRIWNDVEAYLESGGS